MKTHIIKIIGMLVSFSIILGCEQETTSKNLPKIQTMPVTEITDTTALSGGEIISDGGYTITERGVCWGTGLTPVLSDSRTIDGAGAGQFTSTLTNLKGGTTYYVRAYAKNDKGASYGMTMSFKTAGSSPDKPNVLLSPASNINSTSATLHGVVNPRYLTTTVFFEYGTTEQLGNLISVPQNPINGGQDKYVSVDIVGLLEGTNYYFRINATNSSGTNYSEIQSLKTLGSKPNATTIQPTNVTVSTARLNGIINPNHALTDISFEYGLTSIFGMTISPTISQLTGSLDINVSCEISGLLPNTLYYVRLKAINHLGTTYGQTISFLTAYETISDIEGNSYNTVVIGDQIWMRENLKTAKYRNGDQIGTTSSLDLDIQNETDPKYQWIYNGLESNFQEYGRLYTWNSIIDPRGVCPVGWHIPSEQDWLNLSYFLGGSTIAGGKLKEILYSHWSSPNTGATDEVNFSALPSGFRSDLGGFVRLNTYAYYWTSTFSTEYRSVYFAVDYSTTTLYTGTFRKGYGFAIRCIKD